MENQNTTFSKNRVKGYCEGMKNCQIRVEKGNIREFGKNLEDVKKIVEELISKKDKVDAIICADNMIAFQVLNILKRMDIRVPEEVGIVTFDNYPIAEYTDPPMTVIDVDTYALGENAAINLIERIKLKENVDMQTIIPTKMIVRQSSMRKEM